MFLKFTEISVISLLGNVNVPQMFRFVEQLSP
jgi:hypothetical protein